MSGVRFEEVEVFVCSSPKEFIVLIQEALGKIPNEYRDSATLEFGTDYDGCTELKLQYLRPETPEEENARINRERHRDLQMLKVLQERLGL